MLTQSSRSVAGATVLVAFGFLGSRLLGALRQIVLADEFGASGELDAFFIAMRLPELVFQVLAGATLAAAFIPVYARYITRRGEDEAWRLASIVLNAVLVATVVIAVIGVALADWIVPALAPGLGEDSGMQDELRRDAIFLTRVMLLSPILFAVSGMITGILNARQHFLLPALAPMLYNLSIIGGAVLLSGSLGVDGLAVGVLVGAGLHLVVQLPALLAARARLTFTLRLGDPGAREVLRLMAPRTVGLAAGQINFIVLTFFASFIGDSSISALNFAWTILLFPVGLFGMSLAMAMFPTLAMRAASGQQGEVREMVSRTLRFTLFLSIPAGVGMILLREPLIRVLFEHGEFTRADTDLVADALLFYSVGLFAHAAIEILSRGYYAMEDTRTPVAFAVGSMLLNLVLAAALVGPLELQGLALAISIATIVEAVGLFVVLNGRLQGELWTRAVAGSLLRTSIATVLMAEAVGAVLLALGDGGDFGRRSLFALLVGTVVGVVVYHSAALILRLEEAHLVTARLQTELVRFLPWITSDTPRT